MAAPRRGGARGLTHLEVAAAEWRTQRRWSLGFVGGKAWADTAAVGGGGEVEEVVAAAVGDCIGLGRGDQ